MRGNTKPNSSRIASKDTSGSWTGGTAALLLRRIGLRLLCEPAWRLLRWQNGILGESQLGKSRSRRGYKKRTILNLEALENRLAPAGPDWSALGPAPQGLGQAAVTGRVTSLAFSPDVTGGNQPALFLGSASGGVWRSTPGTWNQVSPTWTEVSDNLVINGQRTSPDKAPAGINDIGALAVDPKNPKVIYAGTGEANFASGNRYGAGILRSDDGGRADALKSSPFYPLS